MHQRYEARLRQDLDLIALELLIQKSTADGCGEVTRLRGRERWHGRL